jgi:hypothetical protein
MDRLPMHGFPTTTLHLSTLGGLHVIDADECDPGNVFQSTIRGRWGMCGVFYVETGERLIVDADGRARWRLGTWEPKPYAWGRAS